MSIKKQDYEMISILRDIILEFNKQLSNNSQEGLDLQIIKVSSWSQIESKF